MIRKLTMAAVGAAITLSSIGASAEQFSYSGLISTTGGNLGISTIGTADAPGVDSGETEMGGEEPITVPGRFLFNGTALAFLYDGPEWADTQETVVLNTTFLNGETSTSRLTNDYVDATDQPVLLLVDNVERNDLLNCTTQASYEAVSRIGLGTLFGDHVRSSVTNSAETGECGSGPCTDSSDHAIQSIDITDARATTVPEPGTIVMFVLGMVLVGFGFYRRRQP